MTSPMPSWLLTSSRLCRSKQKEQQQLKVPPASNGSGSNNCCSGGDCLCRCCWHNVHHRYPVNRTSTPSLVCPFCFQPINDVGNRRRERPGVDGGLGAVYYDELCCTIDKYVELGTADRVCFVGRCADASRVLPLLTERYCLTLSATVVFSCRCQQHHTAGASVDEIFPLQFNSDSSSSKCLPTFDKIILCHSVETFDDLPTCLVRIMRSLAVSNRGHAVLLIVHRPLALNTLPLPQSFLARLRHSDIPMERIVSTLQSLGIDFRWELEDIRVVLSRRRWIDLLMTDATAVVEGNFDGSDSPSMASTTDAAGPMHECDAVHELTTGIMRYTGSSDSDMEFTDRLLFVTVSRQPTPSCRGGAAVVIPKKVNLFPTTFGPLEMVVTPEVKAILDERHVQPKRRR